VCGLKKILIVEDDQKISQVLSIRLRAAGYEVAAAFDAVMASSVAVKTRPDLVILDISMPGGDGFQVAERIQLLGATAGVPMIFITASKKPEFRQKALELGAVGFFEKPYEPEELLAAVRTAIGDSEAVKS
jgi:DNA-binding response OmpR family regulator